MPRRRTIFEKNPQRRRSVEKRLRRLFNGVAVCAYCGEIIADGDVTLDHVVPVSKGGTDKTANMVLCCGSCNLKKGEDLWQPKYRRLKDLPREKRPPKKSPKPLMTIGDAWPDGKREC